MWNVNVFEAEADNFIFVSPFWDHEHRDGRLYSGLGIEVATPYKKDVKKDLYYATFHPAENAVMLHMPSVTYLQRHCRENAAFLSKALSERDDHIYIPSDELRKTLALIAISKDPKRQETTILFKVPPSHPIVNSVFSNSDADGERVTLNVDAGTLDEDEQEEEEQQVVEGTAAEEDRTEGTWMFSLKWYVTFKEGVAREWKTSKASKKSAGAAALDGAISGMTRLALGSRRT